MTLLPRPVEREPNAGEPDGRLGIGSARLRAQVLACALVPTALIALAVLVVAGRASPGWALAVLLLGLGAQALLVAKWCGQLTGQVAATIHDLERRSTEQERQLAATAEAARRRAEQFRVMNEVGQRMTTLIGMDELLDHIVRQIQAAFGYHHVGIGLIEDDVVYYRAGAGPVWEQPNTAFVPARLKVGQEGITGRVAATGQPMLVPDVTREPAYVDMQGSQARSELAVPIQAKGRVMGVLDVQSTEPGAFDASDVSVLQSLANQAAIAIENARLYERARDLAVLEERQRVARDLHDSVTQSLYGVTLFADGIARLLATRQLDEAAGYLDQLRETARAALSQMRLLIFELRPPELETVGLAAAIEARLDSVEARAGVQTQFTAEGDVRAAPQVEDAFYRIAQEALNNALKHARAHTVRVHLARRAAALQLTIADDGVGFDLVAARAAGGLGLQSMRERTARLGGTLQLDSAPGSGTRLTVEVPL